MENNLKYFLKKGGGLKLKQILINTLDTLNKINIIIILNPNIKFISQNPGFSVK